MTDWEQVGLRVQARRKALGLSQAQLGARLGLTGNNVAQVEGGLAVSEKKLDGFANVLGVSVAFLRYGLVTALDRAAVEAEAFEAGRQAVFQSLRGWLGREEHTVRREVPAASVPEARFTGAEFTEVPASRREEILRRRQAEDAATASTTGRKKNGDRTR